MTETMTVVAEDAPLGVQLWPTIGRAGAWNFTLHSVTVIRSPSGKRVVWEYESGTTREFSFGEEVAVQYSVDYLANLIKYDVGQRVTYTDCHSHAVSDGVIDQVIDLEDGVYLVELDDDGGYAAAMATELEPGSDAAGQATEAFRLGQPVIYRDDRFSSARGKVTEVGPEAGKYTVTFDFDEVVARADQLTHDVGR